MKTTGNCTKLVAVLVGIAALALLSVAPAFAASQASITLTNCNSELCNANNTEWSLDKTPSSQTLTGDNTITWTVSATRGATSDNFITVNGVMTVTNTGSAPATIGNIVVNLQKPRTGPNIGACRNVPWVSAAADVANATFGDLATSAKIVAAGSQENAGCNLLQGPNNYAVSSPQGTFIETAGSRSLEFTDADSNTVWAITPEQTLPVGGSVTLLYTATFDNTVLGLAVGSQVRAEAIVTFGNAGARGGSGATATSIDIDGDSITNTTDEANVRSVPCRVTKAIPALQNGNNTVTLSDLFPDDVAVTGTGVQVGNPSGFGSFDISATESGGVSVDEVCSPPGSATVTNTAHLDGTSSSVIVQGPQIGTDPITGLPIYRTFEFACVTGVALDASANADVTCEAALPVPQFTDGDYCTHTVQQWPVSTTTTGPPPHVTVWSLMDFDLSKYTAAFSSGLRIGYVGASPLSDAFWNANGTGYANLSQAINGATGAAAPLTVDLIDATSMAGGSFTGEVAALALNVGFSGSATSSGTPASFPTGLGLLTYHKPGEPLDGLTITQILAAANEVAGQNKLPTYYGFASGTAGYTAFELVLQNINGAFSKASTGEDANVCKVKQFAQDHLTK